MFKLESYLTPWLLSYLDKYVKLKPEDFKLSLWGGDVVFRKLDLRLNVIEELTNIPITFKSGLIHELRIHIPWTRITSEPVVVTINTLEFVAKLKEQENGSVNKTNTSSFNSSTNNLNKSASSANLGQQSEEQPVQQQQQPLPTGYIQSLINKILANICIIVNNVIVKFVEDDIVLSFNMKSAECFSVNNQWEKTFVEINSQNIDLKKILQLNDCTICLDKLDNKKNSKVNYYQDPLIYRFSIQSRLDFTYNLAPPSSNTTNQITFEPQINLIKLNFYCRKFDASISDQQLPMIIRLIELIMAIVDDTLVLPESENNNINDDIKSSATESVNTSMLISVEQSNDPPKLDDLNLDLEQKITVDEQPTSDQEQSWISWAWSYVPSVTNIMDDETDSLNNSINPPQNETSNNKNNNNNNDIQIMIGVYIDELNVSFKLIEHSNQSQQQSASASSSSSRSYYFSQFLLANAKGIAVEIDKKKDFLHLISGISYMDLKSVGECCCKLCPKPSLNEIIFLKAGCEDLEEKTFHYLSDSLFDVDENEINNQNIIKDIIIKDIPSARDQHGNLDETYGSKRFGAFYMDIFNKIESNAALDSFDLNSSQIMSTNDIYSQSFIFYGPELNISANFFHRLFKLIDRAQSHSYSRPYSSLFLNQQPNFNTSQLDSNMAELNLNNEINSKLNIESLAKKLEKHIPLINTTFTLKDPSIKFYPYSHFLISTSQEVNYECFLHFTVKYIYFNISRPVDEKSLFDVVSKLTNPSKKLIYDSYIHNQIIIDTFKVNLKIIDQQLFSNVNQRKSLKQHEFTLLEPCYLELHFSNVIMQPDMWSKQYFPLNEVIVELPVLKLNIHKQTLFILNDYFDNYLMPVLNQNIFNQIKKPNITKAQMKQAKLRQIIYKRLLEDFLQQSKFKRTEIIQICLNDFKFRYSITKIMQVIQLNCNMLNCYFLRDEKHQDQLIQLFESSNKNSDNNKSFNKDFLVLRAQLPLSIDSNNSYIPDPLFIYANVSPVNINLRDELIYWLSYKPTRGDDELVNLLIMELFDDSITDPEMNENLNNFKIANQTISSHKSDKLIESSVSSALYRHKTITTTTKSIRSVSVSSKSSLNTKFHTHVDQHSSLPNTSSVQPTIIDTCYDLLKSVHLQISIKPIKLTLKNLDASLSNHLIVIEMPHLDIKSAGTKCDLEEELINSKLIELPCSYLRACERTSNKLPWLIDLKELKIYYYKMDPKTENIDIINSMFDYVKEKRDYIMTSINFNSLFTVKPMYNHHDNLLSSLSIIFNMDIQHKIDINFKNSHLNFLISWLIKLNRLLTTFRYKIDFKEFQPNINYDQINQDCDANNTLNTDWDENKSYSVISILKEYELSSFDEDKMMDINDDSSNLEEYSCLFSNNKKDEENSEHCSLSTSELSSSSSSMSVNNKKIKRKIRKNNDNIINTTSHIQQKSSITLVQATSPLSQRKIVHDYSSDYLSKATKTAKVSIMREKLKEKVNLNFALFLSISHINLNLVVDDKTNLSLQHRTSLSDYDLIRFSVSKIKAQLDINNTFQKLIFMIKKFQINNDLIVNTTSKLDNKLENLIFTSENDTINKNLFNKTNLKSTSTSNNHNGNFMEITFTRALISNLNKRLNDLSEIKSTSKSKVNRSKKSIEKLLSHNKWIIEINVLLNNLDFMIHTSNFDILIEYYLTINNIIEKSLSIKDPYLNTNNNTNNNNDNDETKLNYHNNLNKSKKIKLIPLIKASDMPLLNIEINRVRIIFPYYDLVNKSIKFDYDLIIAQMYHLTLTSQIENPIIRNFINNSSTKSFNIYNKAKSNGSLYRPGFAFEDRQYALEIKNISLFKSNSTYLPTSSKINEKYANLMCLPILDSFDVKAMIGLPILLGKLLINGYVFELNIPTSDLTFYLDNREINLISNIVNENLNLIKSYDLFSHTKSSINNNTKNNNNNNNNNKRVSTGSFVQPNQTLDLDIVPLDILITAENINICLFTIDKTKSNQLEKSSLFWIRFIQPYLCLIMHEKFQKFDLSVFDFSLSRSTPSSSKSQLIQNDEYKLPVRNDFIMPVIESKKLDANPKNGITASFFSFKMKNFGHLFCYTNSCTQKNKATSSKNHTATSLDISNEIMTASEDNNLILSCSNCYRCYQFKIDSNNKFTDLFKLNNVNLVNNLEETCYNDSNDLITEILIERPLRIKANLIFYSQLNQFLKSLEFLENKNSSEISESSNKKLNQESSDTQEALSQILFDLNINLITSQIVIMFEINLDDASLKSNNLLLNISSINLNLNKLNYEDDSNDSNKNHNSKNILLKLSNNYSNMFDKPFKNCVNFNLKDFQCKISYESSNISSSSKFSTDYLDFLGPITINCFLFYSSLDKEFYSNIDIDSFNVFINRQLVDFFMQLQTTLNHITTSDFIDQSQQISNNDSIFLEDSDNENNVIDDFNSSIFRFNDDLRTGSFKYTIIDDSYLKSCMKNSQNNLWLLSHLRLPKVNEAVCVDDLNIINQSDQQQKYDSFICWRYSTRRALINLKIKPLPFVGVANEFQESTMKTIEENSELSNKKNDLKCYLEYLNECKKRFTVLKEFVIQDGQYTNVLEDIHLKYQSTIDYKSLIYAKVWRIRLSNEAKRFIYASSLLASTQIDSVELNQNFNSNSSLIKKIIHSHVELNITNMQLKLNSISPVVISNTNNDQNKKSIKVRTADMFTIDFNDLSFRFLNDFYINGESQTISNFLSTNIIGQFTTEFCEYRFLTNRTLIDSLQFKLNLGFHLLPTVNNFQADLDIDTASLLFSQSALISLKQLINELTSNNNSELEWIPHYYLIVNDTNFAINAKQFDTEETCLIKSNSIYSYTWRTHKKPQLMQLYISKYKMISKPFQCNENGKQEIYFKFNDSNAYISLLVSIEDKSNNLSSFKSIKNLNLYKKKIIIQSKLVFSNYLNAKIEKIYFNYSCNNIDYEISLDEPILKLSRSNSTYELIQKESTTNEFNIKMIKINNMKYASSYNDLKNGILCYDSELNIKYWLNLYEQSYKPYVNQLHKRFFNIANISANSLSSNGTISLNESKSDRIIAYNIVLTPIFIFCSYLPYEINIEFLNKSNIISNKSSMHLVKPNSISYLSKANYTDYSNQFELKFDHLLNKYENINEEDQQEQSPLKVSNKSVNKLLWFERNINTLRDGSFNVSKCYSFKNKSLLYSNLFKYAYLSDDASNIKQDSNSISLDISAAVTPSTPSKEIPSVTSDSNATNVAPKISLSSGKFQIEKKTCWNFSKTLRVNIKPICLLINKTNYRMSIIEKVIIQNDGSEDLNNHHLIDSNGGQLCLDEIGLGGQTKKYKFKITLDEYSVDELNFNNKQEASISSSKFDFKKNEIDYESNWIEIKDEPVSPFYRERNQYKMNVLYANKCWLDLKLYPIRADRPARLKQIYLLLQNDEWNESIRNLNQNSDNPSIPDSSIRLIYIQTKFIINNKTSYDINLQVDNNFFTKLNDKNIMRNKKIERFINFDDSIIKSNEFYSTGDVVNANNIYINDKKLETECDNNDENSIKYFENDDLFYLSIREILKNDLKNAKFNNLIQSKPLVLAIKEKAIKQTANFSGSGVNLDENNLISRQCFNLYYHDPIGTGKIFIKNKTCSFILTQKLLVNENNGRLLVRIKEDRNYLVNLFNMLDVDIYVWPRISSNYIFENYVRNVNMINEKDYNEILKEETILKRKSHSPPKSKSKIPINQSNNNQKFYDRSLSFMHLIPAKTSFKFNYDFIGTNYYPIDNLNEQVFFMFAIVNNNTTEHKIPFDLSPNLCRLYETKHEINFEYDKITKLHYLSSPNASNQLNTNRFITNDFNEFQDFLNQFSILTSTRCLTKSKFKFNLNIDCLTLALNDDCSSQIYQTEILRLRSDNICLCVDKFNQNMNEQFNISVSCQHLQLDNQLFSLDETTFYDNTDLTKSAQKFDFPVIFIARDNNLNSINRKSTINFYKSHDTLRYNKNIKIDDSNRFAELKIILVNSTNATESIINMSLTEFYLDIKPFDVYLEDYLIYNLIKIGIEFLEIYSFFELEGNNDLNLYKSDHDLQLLNTFSNSLDILVDPIVMSRKININNIDCLVSLQTSIKIYLATYKMPILFDQLSIVGFPWCMMSSPQFTKMITSHYLTALIFRAGWLLGSLDFIGTPTVFIQQVSNGVYDFLQMPYRGLREYGPGGLLRGLSSGSLSLIRNLSSGTITSLTSFASFVSRNMDILSFDPHHLERQEKLRHQSSTDSFGTGLLQVSSSFIITIMGAIGGLAEQPLQSVHNSDSLIKGVSKGLIGLITKPVGAVAELVNQTGQGLLRITGSNLLPPIELRLERKAINKEFSRYPISITKCLWKLISSDTMLDHVHINAMIDAVVCQSFNFSRVNSSNNNNADLYNLTGCYLILSEDILYIVDKNEDMLLRAFYISQIDINIKKTSSKTSSDSSILVVTLHSGDLNENFSQKYENNLDRLVDYVYNQSSNKSNESQLSSTSTLFNRVNFKNVTNDFELMSSLNKLTSITQSSFIQNNISVNNQHLTEFNLIENLLKLNKSMPDYYRYSNLIINNYLNFFNDLPCHCGFLIDFLNKNVNNTINNQQLIHTSIYLSNSAASSSSNISNQTLMSSSKFIINQHNRQKSNSEIILNIDSINDASHKQIRQPSICNEVPKIHRISEKSSQPIPKSPSSSSFKQLNSLLTPTSSSYNFKFHPSYELFVSDTNSTTSSTNKQQQFFYFVDPRISNNFINIFNTLKRKLTNKGFQF